MSGTPNSERLLETLDLFDGKDFRINGCACSEDGRCFMHSEHFPKLRADVLSLSAALERTRRERDEALAELVQRALLIGKLGGQRDEAREALESAPTPSEHTDAALADAYTAWFHVERANALEGRALVVEQEPDRGAADEFGHDLADDVHEKLVVEQEPVSQQGEKLR